jgi:hypothetical protein
MTGGGDPQFNVGCEPQFYLWQRWMLQSMSRKICIQIWFGIKARTLWMRVHCLTETTMFPCVNRFGLKVIDMTLLIRYHYNITSTMMHSHGTGTSNWVLNVLVFCFTYISSVLLTFHFHIYINFHNNISCFVLLIDAFLIISKYVFHL